MDWDDLKHILAVARTGKLSTAAHAIGVDPTTVGRRIVAVEGRLSTRLFDRTPDGFRLTAAGEAAAAEAEAIEARVLSVEARLSGSDARAEGPVRITALDGLIDGWIVPALPGLLARYPRLDLTLVSGFETLRLSRREADIALRQARPSEPDAVVREVGAFAIAAYCASGSDFGPAPPIIAIPREREAMAFSRLLHRLFPESRVAVRANAESHAIAAARAGIGVALVDCFAGDRDPGLRRFLPDVVDLAPLLAVTHVDVHKAPRVRAVTDFLIDLHRSQADLIEGRQPRRDA